MVAEMRAFGIGLFATVMLARVISILDLDPRPNPTPLVLSNQGVFFFFLFAVCIRPRRFRNTISRLTSRTNHVLITCRSLSVSCTFWCHPCRRP